MPGPGAYDQHSQLGSGRAAAIRGKPSPERANGVPGPGEYQSNVEAVKDRIKSARILGEKRELLKISEEELQKPGPG